MLIIASYRPQVHLERETYFRRVLARPWKKILPMVGLPSLTRTIRLLRKLPLDHCHWQTIERLKLLLNTRDHPWLRVLPHFKRITRDTLGLLGTSPSMVTPKLLLASADSQAEEEPVHWTLTGIKALRRERGHTGRWPYRGFSFDTLKVVCERLDQEVHGHEVPPFPPPPFPGRLGIRPLVDFPATLRESHHQNNCSLTFAGEIIAGKVYLYSVRHPERATLSLRKDDVSGEWGIQELRGPDNADVSTETMAYVQSWFAAALLSSGLRN